MKLLQTMAGGSVGGAEEFFVRLATALDQIGMNQRLVVRPNKIRNNILKQAGLSVRELKYGNRLDRGTISELTFEIDRFAPNIVLSWMGRASIISGQAINRACQNPVLIGRLGGYYKLKRFRKCNYLIANTPDIVDYLIGEGWPQERVCYVPNFVDPQKGIKIPKVELGIPENAPLLLAAGRLHTNKAFDVLLAAMAICDEVHLMIAGNGEQAGPLHRLAMDLGVHDRVRFLGWRTDMSNLMATADLLVCPSRSEPLGNIVIEAWARNLPVIAAASQGPSWLIRHNEDGVLVPVDDSNSMANAISLLCRSPKEQQRLSLSGQKRYQEEFTEEIVVKQFLSLFRRVIS
tara:strand:+ start:1285 stop:2325 length:1041 start_codon:yes stop_codon:yes gene_type:complete